jgi:hypothetical protein
MGRWGRSIELVKLCWGVLRQDKELVVFPVVSGHEVPAGAFRPKTPRGGPGL